MEWTKEFFIGSPIYKSEDGRYSIKYMKSKRHYEIWDNKTGEILKTVSSLATAKKFEGVR